MRFYLIWFLVGVTGGGILVSGSADSSVASETRSVLQEWVRVRALISEERERWAAEREELKETIQLLELERSALNEQIEERKAAASEATSEREDLLASRQSLEKTAGEIALVLSRHETAMQEWTASLPEVLRSDIGPLLRRLPTSEESANALGLGRRLQTIIGILSQADRFNGNLTFRRELRDDPASGASRETDTLYFGLATAVYSDPAGSMAGFGVPGESGWEWTSTPEDAPAIRDLMSVYRNDIRAQYVGIRLRAE